MLFEEIVAFLAFITPRVLAASCMPKCGVPSDWLSIARNVCYGTKHNKFGKFTVNRDCELYAIRLSHVSGLQSGVQPFKKHGSRWGYSSDYKFRLSTFLVKDGKVWLTRRNDKNFGFYFLKGFKIDDDVIVIKGNETLTVGTKIRIAFGPDYGVKGVKDNEGTHCVDVDISCFV